MKSLQEATERICELKGGLMAVEVLLAAMLDRLPRTAQAVLGGSFDAHAEAGRTILLHSDISEHVLAAFELGVARTRTVLNAAPDVRTAPGSDASVEAVLLSCTRIATFQAQMRLTGASGFFFRRDDRLFVVTSRHVLADGASGHFPDRIGIELHVDARDLSRCVDFILPLYADGRGLWRQMADGTGLVDVAAVEVDVARLPADCVFRAYGPEHLLPAGESVEVGDRLSIVGFPLGFHDTIHHLPVVRHAAIASAYGVRFQQQGCFLTDARTHRGSSGAPVLRRRSDAAAGEPLPWQLLGVHSTRMDMRDRDLIQDDWLGLNCAWYANVLLALTEGRAAAPAIRDPAGLATSGPSQDGTAGSGAAPGGTP